MVLDYRNLWKLRHHICRPPKRQLEGSLLEWSPKFHLQHESEGSEGESNTHWRISRKSLHGKAPGPSPEFWCRLKTDVAGVFSCGLPGALQTVLTYS